MMIEVNLVPGRQAKGPGFKLPDFKGLLSGVQHPWAFAGAVIWAIVIAFVGATFLKQAAQGRRLAADLETTAAEYDRFARIVEDKRNAERARDSLLVEINAIRGIDSDRYIWPHVLDEVARAVPDLTWLTNVTEVVQAFVDTTATARPLMTISIQGQTLDVQAYTRFQRNLEASPWLANVSGTSFATAFLGTRPITTFNLQVQFTQADSSYIQTVPLLESVR